MYKNDIIKLFKILKYIQIKLVIVGYKHSTLLKTHFFRFLCFRGGAALLSAGLLFTAVPQEEQDAALHKDKPLFNIPKHLLEEPMIQEAVKSAQDKYMDVLFPTEYIYLSAFPFTCEDLYILRHLVKALDAVAQDVEVLASEGES